MKKIQNRKNKNSSDDELSKDLSNINIQNIDTCFVVENVFLPIRLDIYCCGKLNNFTRSKLKTGIKSIYVNSVKAKLSRQVKNGDFVKLVWENPIPEYAKPENIPVRILYEDENIIVVNKAAGMVTHPAGGNWEGTLVNALNYYRLFTSHITDEFSSLLKFAENAKKDLPDLFRLGIVHRLDKETSGVIITARNFKTESFLKNEFKNRRVKKYYIAILNGEPKEKQAHIKTSVFRSESNRKKFAVSKDLSKGKIAHSAYRILKTNGNYSLAVFKIFTGRTHQIRLHSKFIGCPILGDLVYGKKNKEVCPCGLMLHSYKLIIKTDKMQKLKKEFKADIPKNFKQTLKRTGLWQ